MRIIADVLSNEEGVKRLMIHETKDGAYLFGFNQTFDSSGIWDEWYETTADAKEAAQVAYQVSLQAWTQIADPCKDCQQDWIQPVRIKGRNLSQPEWGKLERLVDGQWLAFNPKNS
jgi:hypothetical protein